MSRISPEEISRVARLSRLDLSARQAELYADQLSAILDYADTLNQLDLAGVEPTSHSLPLTNVFREDTPAPSLPPEEALRNAPESESQCFKVPPIIQG